MFPEEAEKRNAYYSGLLLWGDKLMKFCTLKRRPFYVLLGPWLLPGRHTAAHGMAGLSQRPGPPGGAHTAWAEPLEVPQVLCGAWAGVMQRLCSSGALGQNPSRWAVCVACASSQHGDAGVVRLHIVARGSKTSILVTKAGPAWSSVHWPWRPLTRC